MTARLVCYVHPARSKKNGRAYLSGFDRNGGRWWVLSPAKPGDAWTLKYDPPEGRVPAVIDHHRLDQLAESTIRMIPSDAD